MPSLDVVRLYIGNHTFFRMIPWMIASVGQDREGELFGGAEMKGKGGDGAKDEESTIH